MPYENATSCTLSQMWCDYFRSNSSSADNLPWDTDYTLSNLERVSITNSVQQFQLGEGAEGRRLLMRGENWARSIGDPYCVRALSLFIKEEQRHSRILLQFMRRERIPAVQRHWLDEIFRRIRVLAGLELELRVLVTAEVIAVPYYRALGRATKSPLLHAISSVILVDEAGHLRFQKTILTRLGERRDPGLRCLVTQLHRVFLIGTCCVVWAGHRRVFHAANYSFGRFLEESLSEMSVLEAPSTEAEPGRFMARSWPRL